MEKPHHDTDLMDMPCEQSAEASTTPVGIDLARNVVAIGAVWLLYRYVRELTEGTEDTAVQNAERLLDFQANIGLAIEDELQTVFDFASLMTVANAYYLVHFPVTIGVLALAFIRDRNGVYVRLRNSLLVVTGIALVVHAAVPLAPPRMLSGFIDASLKYGPDPYSLPGSDSANQFAAMPSMHVAWAVLVGAGLWSLSSRRTVRFFAIAHPLLTTFVAVITAHHFLTDAIVGAAMATAAVLTPTVMRSGALRRG